jgi:hypothetical protein
MFLPSLWHVCQQAAVPKSSLRQLFSRTLEGCSVDISFISTRVSRFAAYTIHLSYITVASRELVFLTNGTRTYLLRYLSKKEVRFTQNTLEVLSSSHRRQD